MITNKGAKAVWKIEDSQYNIGGESACTVISLEFAAHVLKERKIDEAAITTILYNGVNEYNLHPHAVDHEDIYTACTWPRYENLLTKCSQHQGYLADVNQDNFIGSIKRNAFKEILEKLKSQSTPSVLVITKPPETIAVLYATNLRTFFLFDSHKSNIFSCGAYVAEFGSMSDLDMFLLTHRFDVSGFEHTQANLAMVQYVTFGAIMFQSKVNKTLANFSTSTTNSTANTQLPRSSYSVNSLVSTVPNYASMQSRASVQSPNPGTSHTSTPYFGPPAIKAPSQSDPVTRALQYVNDPKVNAKVAEIVALQDYLMRDRAEMENHFSNFISIRTVEISEIKKKISEQATAEASIEVEKYKRELEEFQLAAIERKTSESQLKVELEQLRAENEALRRAATALPQSCCPTPGCSNSFQWIPSLQFFNCEICKRFYCLICISIGHNGPCEQHQAVNGKHILAGKYGINVKMCAYCCYLSSVPNLSYVLASCPKCKQTTCYGCGSFRNN